MLRVNYVKVHLGGVNEALVSEVNENARGRKNSPNEQSTHYTNGAGLAR